MTYAILSDIHANLDALERVVADAKRCGATRFVCLGDIVGYGPLPRETLTRIRTICRGAIAGNHDDAVSGRGDSASFIDLAGDAVARHRDALDADALAWLKGLPHALRIGDAVCVHGDVTDPAKFYYIEDEDDARANFAACEAPLVFCGHTHIPGLFLTGASGTIYRLPPQDFALEAGKRYIVNVGSVGYPREANGPCHSTYVLYDTKARTVTFRLLPFAVSSVMQRGRSPRRLGKGTLLVLLLLAVLATAVTTFRLRGKETITKTVTKTVTEKVTETNTIDSAAALIVDKRTLELPPGATKVNAGLALAKGSDPVQLAVKFLDANDHPMQIEARTIKPSVRKQPSGPSFKCPKPAVRVLLSVSRVADGDRVVIDHFTPEVR